MSQHDWLFGAVFVTCVTYTAVDLTRRITEAWDARDAARAHRRLRPTIAKRASTRMARPLTLKERNARRRA